MQDSKNLLCGKLYYFFNGFAALFLVFISSSVLRADVFSHTMQAFGVDQDTHIAKRNALNEAKYSALFIVLRKIILEEDFDKVKNLVDSLDIRSFDLGFQITDESIANSTYSASVRFDFDKEVIHSLLDRNGIFYIQREQGTVLLIPEYFEYGSKQSNNLWFNYWISLLGSAFLTSYIPYLPEEGELVGSVDYVALASNLGLDYILHSSLHKYSEIIDEESGERQDFYRLIITDYENHSTTVVDRLPSLAEAAIVLDQKISSANKLLIQKRATSSIINEVFTVYFDTFEQWIGIKLVLDEIFQQQSMSITRVGQGYTDISLQSYQSLKSFKDLLQDSCILLDEELATISYSNTLCEI